MEQPRSSNTLSARERRDAWVADQVARTGIDEVMIRRLVDHFYEQIRRDDDLAPIFAARVSDWPSHLNTMYDFWSGVALMTGRYKGKPVLKHAPLPLRPNHFARWLELFRESATAICTTAAAEFFITRAERVAESLQAERGQSGLSLVRCTNIAIEDAA